MALAAACAAPLAGLALIAAPWRFAGFRGARADIAQLWATAKPAAEAMGLVPMEVLQAGFWRLGLAGDSETELKDALGSPRIALVLGAEGVGLRPNTREHCDALARLPISGAIESLNVSNAAAVALYAASSHG